MSRESQGVEQEPRANSRDTVTIPKPGGPEEKKVSGSKESVLKSRLFCKEQQLSGQSGLEKGGDGSTGANGKYLTHTQNMLLPNQVD